MTTVPLPDTRQAAISLVVAAIRGDDDAVRFALDMCDADEFVPMFHASLALLRALASRLRSAEGLMAVDVKLAEISREHRNRDTCLAAQLILGHARTCYPPIETITAAETFDNFYSIGASTFNDACCRAHYGIIDVFMVALAMWRSLLPEVVTAAGPCMVGNVAAQLWGIRAEPAPPEPIRNLDGRTALTIENRDVERRASTDMTPPPPPPPTLPPGAPRARGEVGPGGIPARPILPPGVPLSRVSLRGLAELRRRAAEE